MADSGGQFSGTSERQWLSIFVAYKNLLDELWTLHAFAYQIQAQK